LANCILDGAINGRIIMDGIARVWYERCLVHVVDESFVATIDLDGSGCWLAVVAAVIEKET